MKLLLLKRKLLTLCVCLLCAAAMFYIVSHPAIVGAAATTRQLPIYCVQRDQKVVALSFDAAWGNAILRHYCPNGLRVYAIPTIPKTVSFFDRARILNGSRP